MQEGVPVAISSAALSHCSLLAPHHGHSMRKDPPFDASRAPIRTIPHSRSCYGTPNSVLTRAPTPAPPMSHNPKTVTDCFLTDSVVAEIKGGCWPERASSLLCCSARMLSALALAARVEPGNRGPDLVAGPDYARADLARIKLVQVLAASDSNGTDGEMFPGEADAKTNPTPPHYEQPCGKAPQPKKQLHKSGVGWALLRSVLPTAWDTRMPRLHTGTPAAAQCQELAGPTKQGRKPHRHPNKSHGTMLFLDLSQHASIASQMLQKCLQDIGDRMWHVLSRILLSTRDPSVPIVLRCFPATVKYHQGLGSTESQIIWSYGFWEKGKHSIIILAMLTISFFLLQLFHISNIFSVLLFTLCHCVFHWIFIQKTLPSKATFVMKTRDLKSENCLLLPASNLFLKRQRKRQLSLHKRQAGGQQSWYILVQLKELDWFCSLCISQLTCQATVALVFFCA